MKSDKIKSYGEMLGYILSYGRRINFHRDFSQLTFAREFLDNRCKTIVEHLVSIYFGNDYENFDHYCHEIQDKLAKISMKVAKTSKEKLDKEEYFASLWRKFDNPYESFETNHDNLLKVVKDREKAEKKKNPNCDYNITEERLRDFALKGAGVAWRFSSIMLRVPDKEDVKEIINKYLLGNWKCTDFPKWYKSCWL